MIYLVRHGEPGSPQIDAEGWFGPARDWAPLTAAGVEQAKAVGRELRGVGARRIVASPMTRALRALRRQTVGSEPFVAVCHATVIRALTGHVHTDFCGVRVFDGL